MAFDNLVGVTLTSSKKCMRILLVSNIFPPMTVGGYELVARDLARRLHCDSHRVAVVSSPLFGDSTSPHEAFEIFRVLQCIDHSPEIFRKEDVIQLGLFINLDNVRAMKE